MSKAPLHEANQCLFPQQAQGGRGRGLLSQVWDGVGVGAQLSAQPSSDRRTAKVSSLSPALSTLGALSPKAAASFRADAPGLGVPQPTWRRLRKALYFLFTCLLANLAFPALLKTSDACLLHSLNRLANPGGSQLWQRPGAWGGQDQARSSPSPQTRKVCSAFQEPQGGQTDGRMDALLTCPAPTGGW